MFKDILDHLLQGASCFGFGLAKHLPSLTRHVIHDHDKRLTTSVRLNGMLLPQVNMDEGQPCFGEGATRRGVHTLLAFGKSADFAFTSCDDAANIFATAVGSSAS